VDVAVAVAADDDVVKRSGVVFVRCKNEMIGAKGMT
jgi:hypothetical protein